MMLLRPLVLCQLAWELCAPCLELMYVWPLSGLGAILLLYVPHPVLDVTPCCIAILCVFHTLNSKPCNSELHCQAAVVYSYLSIAACLHALCKKVWPGYHHLHTVIQMIMTVHSLPRRARQSSCLRLQHCILCRWVTQLCIST